MDELACRRMKRVENDETKARSKSRGILKIGNLTNEAALNDITIACGRKFYEAVMS